jgi:AcrR family transcriptional regulator
MAMSAARRDATDAILDAAEHLLIEVGYAAVTTRKLAERGGVNHGLVHYYFGSMDDVLVRTLERFTDRLIARQRSMYEGSGPFIEKWRTAMRFLDEDMEAGYQKLWLELQAMSWNHPAMRSRLQAVHAEWLHVVSDAFDRGLAELGIDRRRFPVKAVVALVVTFNLGMMLERLGGVDSGHRELLRMADRVITSAAKQGGDRARA